MKRLDRYVISELFVPFLIGTIAVTMMFDANTLIAVQKDLDLSQVPASAIAQFLVYKTPFFLNMTLPVGMALAASLAMSRLARESELTAMRSAGASILRTILPIAVFGFFVAVFNYLLVEKVMPRAELKAQALQRQIGMLVAAPGFTQNTFVKLQNYQVAIGSVNKLKDDRLALTNVLLISHPAPNTTGLIETSGGFYDHGQWTLNNARIWVINGDNLASFHTQEKFPINERISIEDLFSPPAPEQLTASQLKDEINQAKAQGRSSRGLEIQYDVRFSVPASCIIFAFVSPALAIVFARTGGFAGVLLSIFQVFLYYNAYVISTEILGKNGVVSPLIAAWLPNIIFVVIGLIVIRRLE